MRKLKLYIAVSLDGKIATADGSVDWLEEIPNPDGEDYDYVSFLESIDITLTGNNTYKSVNTASLGDIYPGKENYVFTRNPIHNSTDFFRFVSKNPVEFILPRLKEEGKDVWLVGGGQLNTLFMNADLVDEIWLYIMPVALGEGISLFEGTLNLQQFKLLETKTYGSGVVKLKYQRG